MKILIVISVLTLSAVAIADMEEVVVPHGKITVKSLDKWLAETREIATTKDAFTKIKDDRTGHEYWIRRIK